MVKTTDGGLRQVEREGERREERRERRWKLREEADARRLQLGERGGGGGDARAEGGVESDGRLRW